MSDKADVDTALAAAALYFTDLLYNFRKWIAELDQAKCTAEARAEFAESELRNLIEHSAAPASIKDQIQGAMWAFASLHDHADGLQHGDCPGCTAAESLGFANITDQDHAEMLVAKKHAKK